jgi:hypothetical protein
MSQRCHLRKFLRANGKSALPSTTDIVSRTCQVGKGSCVDGSGSARVFFTLQAWSVQPCVRQPVLETIENALRADEAKTIEDDRPEETLITRTAPADLCWKAQWPT